MTIKGWRAVELWQDSKRLSPNRRRGDSKNYKSLLVRRTNERNCDKEKALLDNCQGTSLHFRRFRE